MLFLKVVLIQSYAHTLCTTYSEQKDQTIVSGGRLEGDKYNGKFLNRHPKRWSRSLSRGCRLRKVPTIRL